MSFLSYGLSLAVVWTMIAPSGNLPATFIGGLIIGVPVAYLFRDFFGLSGFTVLRKPLTYVFGIKFGVSLIASNLSMAERIILSGETDASVMEVELGVQNPTAIAVLANCITLTPGTLTMDHLEQENLLIVHCLDGDTGEARKEILEWDRMLQKIFEGDNR